MSAELELRDYQDASIDGLRNGFRAGHWSQLLVAPTGAGKTVIGSSLLKESQAKGSRSIFIVDRTALVDQTSKACDHYGIEHGIIQASHWRFRPSERVQIASAQTLEKRGIPEGVNLIIVDEAHTVREVIADHIKACAEKRSARVIGLTATPFTKGLGELYTNLVNVTTTNRLIGEGWLVPLKVYVAKSPDMTGAKTTGGEWTAGEAGRRGTEIIGDLLDEWQNKTTKHFGGPVKTLVFSATVEHGEEICRQFQSAGFNFQQISYKDSNDDRRRALIDEFRKPDSVIQGLVSCEALAKGFDVPDVLCGIAARPYRKTLSGHIQMIGRLMRPAPGKTFGLWLDHCGNWMRFASDVDEVFENGVSELDDGALDAKIRPDPDEESADTPKCGACGYVMPKGARACPACGHERTSTAIVETLPGEMVEVTSIGDTGPAWRRDRKSVWFQLCDLALQRKRGDEAAAKRFALAQYRTLYNAWPRGLDFGVDPAYRCTGDVRSYVTSRLIAYAKKQQAA